MTSFTFTPTGSPRRRQSKRASRQRTGATITRSRHRMADAAPKPRPMTMDDLHAWVREHNRDMEPEGNAASEQFVLTVEELSGGVIPDYVAIRINPATIVSGEKYDRVYVRFEYKNGGAVTLYPMPTPTSDDWFDYDEYLLSQSEQGA